MQAKGWIYSFINLIKGHDDQNVRKKLYGKKKAKGKTVLFITVLCKLHNINIPTILSNLDLFLNIKYDNHTG